MRPNIFICNLCFLHNIDPGANKAIDVNLKEIQVLTHNFTVNKYWLFMTCTRQNVVKTSYSRCNGTEITESQIIWYRNIIILHLRNQQLG